MSETSSKAHSAASRDDIAHLHEFNHWPALRLWPLIFATLGLALLVAVLPAAYWPLYFVISPTLGVIMFIFVIAFHDAAHNRLHPVYRMNEAFGHTIGTFMFIPLNVYRHAHAYHHACLGSKNDPELWPFNIPGSSRALRVLAAFCEIVFGVVYSPFLFLRSVSLGTVSPDERKKIIRGYVACAIKWTVMLGIVYAYNLWTLLLVALLIPMTISGVIQTVNKYTQHLGLHGRTVLGLTRTVIDEHRAGEVVSSAMFYNDYHGTHHRYAKIPYYNLPSATPYTVANASEFCPVYPHLGSAFVAMLPCLADPKVGPQWLDGYEARSRPNSASESAELIGAVASTEESYF